MKNSIGVGYKGVVKIWLQRGNKKPYKTVTIHNEGTDVLFETLCHCIIGDTVASSMPKYLMIYDDSDNEASSVFSHYESATITSASESSDGVPYVTFQFIIPGAYLIGNTLSRMKLYAGASSNYDALAVLDVDSVGLDKSANLYVSWNMYIGNYEV